MDSPGSIAGETPCDPAPAGAAPAGAAAEGAPPDGDWARPQLDRHLAVLAELTDIGLDIARGLRGVVARSEGLAVTEAAAPDDGDPEKPEVIEPDADGEDGPDAAANAVFGAALAYSRVSRAVRQTVLLHAKLIGELKNGERVVASTRIVKRGERKERIERILWRVAAQTITDDATCNRIVDEAAERLEDETLYDDILSRPISETIAEICRHLGLSPDWPRLANEAWARAELAGGKVGSPLVNLKAAPAAGRPPPRAESPPASSAPDTAAKPAPVDPAPPDPPAAPAPAPAPPPPDPDPPWVDPMIFAELGPRGTGRNPYE